MLNKLELRVLEISHKLKLSHLGSCLNAVNLIDMIYLVKDPLDVVVLSQGHAALALYVVLEKNGKGNAEELYKKHGTHPNRDLEAGIVCSTGSLGQGIPIAVGMAIADPKRDVYVVTSDGEMNEGSCWEALRIAGELRIENLKVTVIANGYTGIGESDTELLDTRLQMFYPSMVVRVDMFKYPPFLQGLWGHYRILSDENYQEILDNQYK